MPEARHRADDRSDARKGLLGALVSPFLVAALFVGALVALSSLARAQGPEQLAASAGPAGVATLNLDEMTQLREERAERLSRSAGRPAATGTQVTLTPHVADREFATAPLNIWRGPNEQGPKIGVIEEGAKVAVTDKVVRGWAEIVLKNPERGPVARWVNNEFLAEKKPKPEPQASGGAAVGGLSTAPCPDGSSIESGLTANATRVYRAVCAAFPQPTTYGGLDPHGEHIDGRAIDIMISGETGHQIAEWLRANASTLGIRDIIYAQRIWTPGQAAAGWRPMSDRGSVTANHYDHVHVAVF